MTKPEIPEIRGHEDAAFFREAINFTSARTGFAARLIEKDYFCTVLLSYLGGSVGESLVFRGGTCLAKVHTEFYRMSEDLDYVSPTPVRATRAERRQKAISLKQALSALPGTLGCFEVHDPLTGANNSTQYVGTVAYDSHVAGRTDTIRIEVSQREPLLTEVCLQAAHTILLNPASDQRLVPPVAVACISRVEALAEKFRAALTRREVAVRDFFDIDYALRKLNLRPQEPEFVQLVRQKVEVPGNQLFAIEGARLARLEDQVESRLKPVLRQRDFEMFDLAAARRSVVAMHEAVG